jgi:uncharacterized delta-60 repeat protein
MKTRKRSRTALLARLMAALLVAAVSIGPIEVALADSGDLDLTFDTDGMVTTDFGDIDGGYAVVIQPDGKIVVAGDTGFGLASDFAVARYDDDGSLDTTFSSDGKVITDFGTDYDRGKAIALQPDGKIVVAGDTGFGLASDFAVARYNSDDGSLDTTFDGDGKVTTDFGGSNDEGRAIVVQPDGKIVVMGTAFIGDSLDFAIARYNVDGSLDTTFGGDGKVTTDFAGGSDAGNGVALQPDGKIVGVGKAATSSFGDFALARYNPDGSLDTTFGSGGKVTTDFGNNESGNAVALQPDGKIAVVGNALVVSYDFAVARYNVDGSLDTTFDGDGKVTTDVVAHDYGKTVAVQANGKIVMAGYFTSSSDDPDFTVVRYNDDGSLDTTFGGDGKVTTDFAGDGEAAYGVAFQDDKIVVAGAATIGDNHDFAVVRYMNDDAVVVDSITDVNDGDTSSITALKANRGADGFISLREAIVAANNTPGSSIINFHITGCSHEFTIQPGPPLGTLPLLSGGGTIIDGYSQPGAVEATATTSATLKIEIDGSLILNNSGFNINSADNVIQGLAINGFGWNGIVIGFPTATGNIIRGNHIGTDVAGATALGNGYNGVYLALGTKNNTIGGDEPADRNVISGNGWNGVDIQGANTMSNTVSGNYIGTGADGVTVLSNTHNGVHIRGGTHGNVIGGEGPGQANLIAHNGRSGVRVQESTTIGNAIQRNRILVNTELGIDLIDDTHGGILPPQILATNSGSVEAVGTACPGCTVELFENSDTDGEGERYVGSTTASASGAFTITVGSLSELYLTATATDAFSGTSEFSSFFTATVPIYDHEVFLPLIMRDFP